MGPRTSNRMPIVASPKMASDRLLPCSHAHDLLTASGVHLGAVT
jgi:hypothetical protein